MRQVSGRRWQDFRPALWTQVGVLANKAWMEGGRVGVLSKTTGLRVQELGVSCAIEPAGEA